MHRYLIKCVIKLVTFSDMIYIQYFILKITVLSLKRCVVASYSKTDQMSYFCY